MTRGKQMVASHETTVSAPPHSLKLVAHVAAILAVGRPELSRDGHLRKAAREAVALLDACRTELAKESPKPKPTLLGEYKRLMSDAEVVYPKGSFKRGLLSMTDRGSEALALPVFKAFLRHGKEKSHFLPGVDAPRTQKFLDDYVEDKIKRLRQEGLGGARLANLTEAYDAWYRTIHLPKVRRENGAQGRGVKHDGLGKAKK